MAIIILVKKIIKQLSFNIKNNKKITIIKLGDNKINVK